MNNKTKWHCRKCNSTVNMIELKCGCVKGPSPWEPIVKNKPLSKKDRKSLIHAWAKLQILCSYLENSDGFTEKFSAEKEAIKIWRLLDSVVSKLYDDDL